jgi:hypothetical protein
VPSLPGPKFGQAIEVLANDTKVYVQQVQTSEYRSFRLADLYHGTNPSCPVCPPRQ